MVHHQQLPTNPPTKQNIKAWWNQFGFVQKNKKDTTVEYTYYQRMCCERSSPFLVTSFLLTEHRLFQAHDSADHPVFGKPLKDSLRYASVQISTANASGDLYVWGYIPVVVAKWFVLLPRPTLSLVIHFLVRFHNNSGLYLKENGSFIQLSMKMNSCLTSFAQQPKFLVLSELMDQVDGCEIFKRNLNGHPVYVPFPSTSIFILVLNPYVPYSTANHWTGNKNRTLPMT